MHQRHIGALNAGNQQLPQPIHAKHLFGDDRTAKHLWHAHGNHRDHRDQRVAQHMHQHHAPLAQALCPRGAHVILAEVVHHRRAHIAADLGSVIKGENTDRHDHLFDLKDKTRPARDLMGGVIDRGKPAELYRKDHNHQDAGEKCGHRKPHHGDKCTDLIEPAILAIGRHHANGDRDANAQYIGQAHHP